MRAIVVREYGGPEVLVLDKADAPSASEGQTLIDVTAAGVNYADTHQAENSYVVSKKLPMIPGAEVVGTTEDGQRVVALVNGGGYAEKAVADTRMVFPLADGLQDEQALALVLQGTTAWLLLERLTGLRSGESVVVHAGAGGVGTLAIQIAKHLGAGRIIATASSASKRELAQSLGADVTIASDVPNLTDAIRDANGGKRVDVILEMVGGDTFTQSLQALAPFGRIVPYGTAGRVPAPAIDPVELMMRSQTIVGFWLSHGFSRGLIGPAFAEVSRLVLDNTIRTVTGKRYPLEAARRAHEDLRGRATVGKLVLDVGL